MDVEIKIKFLADGAEAPFYATDGAAGMDLKACITEPIELQPLGRAMIPTGLAIKLPDARYGAFLFARSGLAVKHGVTLSNCVGVIDSDYTGEIKVGLVNLSDTAYTIQPGERIAQMVILEVAHAAFTPVEELEETARGAGGFGSTGRT